MSSILCELFGHKPPCYAKKGWWSPGEQYAKVTEPYTDGIGREHSEVRGKCARCGKEFMICQIHLPKPKKRIK